MLTNWQPFDQALRLRVWLVANRHFQLYNVYSCFFLTLWAEQRKIQQHGVFVHLCFLSAVCSLDKESMQIYQSTRISPSSFAAYLYNPSLQQEQIPRGDWPPKVDSYCVRAIINQRRMLGI